MLYRDFFKQDLCLTQGSSWLMVSSHSKQCLLDVKQVFYHLFILICLGFLFRLIAFSDAMENQLFTRDFWEKRGEYFMLDGDWKNSFAAFFNALHETKDGSAEQVQVLNKIAFIYFYFSKSLGDAEGFYRQVLQIQPYNTTALAGTGDIWFQRTHYRGALEYYERWLRVLERQEPQHSELYRPYFHIGCCYYELADLWRAKIAFERALEINDQDPVLWNNLGNIFFDLQEWKNARNAYEKALFYSSNSLWEAAGYFSGRLTTSEEIIAHYQIFADEYYNLRVYSSLEAAKSKNDGFLRKNRFSQDSKAVKNNEDQTRKLAAVQTLAKEQKIFEQSLSIDSSKICLSLLLSDFQVAHNNLGNLYRLLKEWDLSRLHLQRAIELNPDDASAHANIASLYFDLKQAERAQHHLKSALKLSEHPVYHNNLASVERYRREFKSVGVHYSKTLYWRPDYSNARYNGRFFRKRSQNIVEAYQK